MLGIQKEKYEQCELEMHTYLGESIAQTSSLPHSLPKQGKN